MRESEAKILNIKDLGSLVRKYRTDNGLTQETAAGLLGVSRKLLSEIELGRKNTIEVGKILQILHRLGLEIHVTPKARR